MAINTEAKRRSVGGCIFPLPDGTISTYDRAHTTGFYSGLNYGWSNITIQGINVVTGELVIIQGKYKTS